jgi:hypothetical protein
MASIPLVASDRNIADVVRDAPEGGDAEGDETRPGDSRGVIPSAAV